MKGLLSPQQYGYVQHENLLLFKKGPLSQWYGSYKNHTCGGLIPSFDGVQVNDFKCNCAEQWMMLMKAALFGDEESFNAIMKETSAKGQKELGRKIKNFDQAIWDANKYRIVLYGNILKFTQDERLKNFILQFPKETVFVEASQWDSVWGIGLDIKNPDALDQTEWRGENLLGKALSEVRNVL